MALWEIIDGPNKREASSDIDGESWICMLANTNDAAKTRVIDVILTRTVTSVLYWRLRAPPTVSSVSIYSRVGSRAF